MSLDCLLVYPYFLKADPTQGKQRSPFPPLGLLYVASALRKAGFSVDLLDCTFLSDLYEARHLLLDKRPRAVGIHSMITLTKYGREIARTAKEHRIITIFGGPDSSAEPEKYLTRCFADFVVIGEGEVTAPELLRHVLSGDDPRNVRGVAFLNQHGELVRTAPRELIKDLDGVPLPSRDLIDNGRYVETWRADHGQALTSIMTTRGCPYGCFFCSEKVIYGRRYNVRSPQNVVDELEQVTRNWGYDRVWFADDIFPLIKKRTLAICDEISKRRLNLTWSCLARADLVDSETLRAMRAAGCDQVFYGVESGSQSILDAMNRDMTLQQIEAGVAAAKDAGIRVHAFMMVGFPGENRETIMATRNFLKKISPDEFSFTVAYPLPGTELFHMVDSLSKQLEWTDPSENRLLFKSNVPEFGLKFAVWKIKYEYFAYRRAVKGQKIFAVAEKLFRVSTDLFLKIVIPKESTAPKLSKCEVMSMVLSKLPR